MYIDQDTDTDTGSGTFWTWSNGEFMLAPLLADDKGTHTSSCVSIADISYSFATDVLLLLRYLILFFA